MKVSEKKKKLIGGIVGSLLNKPTINRMRIPLGKDRDVVVHKFVVTGVLYRGNNKRFKLTYPATTAGYQTAMSINLYKGNVWGISSGTGKRVLLKRVNN